MSDLDDHKPVEGGSYRFSKDGKFQGREGGTFGPLDPRHELHRKHAKPATAKDSTAAPKPAKGAPK